MKHQSSIYINKDNRNIHKQMKYYNANFHGDGLLDPDVREVRLFKKTTKARAKEFFLNLYK